MPLIITTGLIQNTAITVMTLAEIAGEGDLHEGHRGDEPGASPPDREAARS